MEIDQTAAVIDFLVRSALKQSKIEKLVLFGSRARSDFHMKSDFDIAIFATKLSRDEWARWSLEARENVPTLCGLDLIFVSVDTSKELISKIKLEGKVIYERSK